MEITASYAAGDVFLTLDETCTTLADLKHLITEELPTLGDGLFDLAVGGAPVDDEAVRGLEYGSSVDIVVSRRASAAECLREAGKEATVEVLEEAVEDEEVELCTLLADAGVPLNPTRALHLAASVGNRELCDVLLKRGSDVNAQTDTLVTPLHSAAVRGHAKVCELLLEHGSAIKGDRLSTTPLHFAAGDGHCETCEVLLKHGSGADARDSNQRRTPLHYAAACNQLRCCELLLKHGADPNAAGRAGQTPLHDATVLGHHDVCALLLKHGATASLGDAWLATPLHGACKYRVPVSVCRLLLESGANACAADKLGRTPLHHAAARGGETAVATCELLLRHGCNVRAKDRSGLTALQHAEQCDAPADEGAVRRLLLSHGGGARTRVHVVAARGGGEGCGISSTSAEQRRVAKELSLQRCGQVAAKKAWLWAREGAVARGSATRAQKKFESRRRADRRDRAREEREGRVAVAAVRLSA